MTIPYRPGNPDSQTVGLVFVDDGVDVTRWLSYDFQSDFLTPTDSFSFVLSVGDTGLPEKERRALKLGARIQLTLEHLTIATGRVDAVEVSADRHGGTIFTVHGRDMLGQTLDAVMDPTFQHKAGGSLAQLLKKVFAPFGWSEEADFAIDAAADRDAKTGNRGLKTRHRGGGGGTRKRKRRSTHKVSKRQLSSIELHQTKPYNHESVFHFASRVAQRHGLWIWCSANGETLNVGKPDFDQEPIFSLHRSRKDGSNVLSGTVRYDLTDQPAILIADGFTVGGTGEFQKGRATAHIINPILGLTDEGDPTPEVAALLKQYPGSVENTLESSALPFRAAKGVPFRPMFLHDDESKTPEHLDAFVKREMSLLHRKALTAHYVVRGHGQVVGDHFVAWAVDTLVEVEDEVADLHQTMYVLGVHFSKSRDGGTTTRLDLILLDSIDF